MRSADASPAGIRVAAERAFAYLAEADPLPANDGDAAPCDAIIGFGVFDLTLPRYCGELHARGIAPRIIFTGGIGAGTGDLGGPEADVWREELRRSHPEIGDEQVWLENRSSNTAQNIGFTAEWIARLHPPYAFGRGIRRAVIVASPSRLRRVWLTMRHLQPAVHTVRARPAAKFEVEQALYARNGIDYIGHLAGELDRLMDYPPRGWIAAETLPPPIAAAHALLRMAVGTVERRPPAP